MAKKKTSELVWRGYPLVRSGNTLYYGNITDPYIAMLRIISTKQVGDLEVADKVSLQLQATGEDVHTRDRVQKRAEKDGLYPALDLASVWLSRALKS